MAPMLAPYNNGMRLGQGFNSYTQQSLLNGAVLKPSETAKEIGKPGSSNETSTDGANDAKNKAPEPCISQIVSYSSRFVNKLSDITDAMNISASLSIKTATIGGSGSGQFVDSDKFKESDLNFFIQVKVTNQTIHGDDYTEFQSLDIEQEHFAEIYGDCFISGFEEGGELNALVSVKVLDKDKTFSVRAELEASLGTPVLSGKVKGGVDMDKAEIKNSTETTVTVNWSGGGQIKSKDALWDVNTLTSSAAKFPDEVAKTPQRTYAILTKYTSLKTFHACQKKYSVLAYENAGVYTSGLLDSYMEYKSIWKQIHVASYELKIRRADMNRAKPSKDILELGQSFPRLKTENTDANTATMNQKGRQINDSSDQKNSNKINIPKIPNTVDFVPYQPTVVGLDKARRDCRNEMIKIVTEVDEVTKNPNLALDHRREDRLVSPRIFNQLLPIVTLRETAESINDGKAPKDPLILGEVPESMWIFNRDNDTDVRPPYAALLRSINHHKGRDEDFDMGSSWSGASDPGKDTVFFNDLDLIDERMTPVSFGLWTRLDESNRFYTSIKGLRTTYSNGKEIEHGDCQDVPLQTIDVLEEGSTGVIQITVQSFKDERDENPEWKSRSIRVVDTASKRHEFPWFLDLPAELSIPAYTQLLPPSNGLWSFRGFWGSLDASPSGGFVSLGVVWGADSPDRRLKATIPAITKVYTGETTLAKDATLSAARHNGKSMRYRMTDFGGRRDTSEAKGFWNDLDDIGDNWRLKQITFYVEKSSLLTGYKSTYNNGREIQHGPCTGTAEISDVRSGNNANGQQVGFTQALIRWAFDTSLKMPVVNALQLFDNNAGYYDQTPASRLTKNEGEVILASPGAGWILGGFWGNCGVALDRLGIIWMKVD